MKVICFVDSLDSEPSDPKELRGDEKLPKGFTATSKRKFIVMRDKNTQPNFVIVIGPVLGGNSYYHVDIETASTKHLPGFTISGGGEVEVINRSNNWLAIFGGESGDFGVFDSEILTGKNLIAVANAMKMSVKFIWEQEMCPAQN